MKVSTISNVVWKGNQDKIAIMEVSGMLYEVKEIKVCDEYIKFVQGKLYLPKTEKEGKPDGKK